MRLFRIAAVILLVMLPGAVVAKEGVYWGLNLVQNTILSDDLDFVESAYGPAIFLGYKFETLSLEGEWVMTEHQGEVGFADADFSGLSINVLLPILTRENRGVLYLLGGYGSYSFDISNGNKLEGDGFNVGLGSEFYFNEKAAQVIRFLYRAIDYDDANNPSVPTPLDGDTITVELGLKYHF